MKLWPFNKDNSQTRPKPVYVETDAAKFIYEHLVRQGISAVSQADVSSVLSEVSAQLQGSGKDVDPQQILFNVCKTRGFDTATIDAIDAAEGKYLELIGAAR